MRGCAKTPPGRRLSQLDDSPSPGFSFSPEAAAALATPEAWKANPGFVDRMIVNGYAARELVTLSCEKDFRRLDLTEVIS